MRTRNEQVQAHRFVTRRIVSALLSGEPETTELPMRRLGLAVFTSVMVATIAFAGIGVYGLIKPGGGKPTENSIIIERESGARFVYLNGRLYPVQNYASARLIMGAASPPVSTLSGKALRDLPRGVEVGIAGAPDALPDRSALLGLPWQLCEGPRSVDSAELTSDLVIGATATGGADPGPDGVLVSVAGSAGANYLILRGRRLRIESGQVLAALNMAAISPLVVDDAFINAIPAGPDLAVPVIPGRNGPSTKSLSGVPAQIGRLYRVNDQYYVVLASGLATIGEVTADLLVAGGARSATDISPSIAGRALSGTGFDPPGMPRTLWRMRQLATGTTICASYDSGTDATNQKVTVSAFDQIPELLSHDEQGAVSAPRTGDRDLDTADRIVVPGGHGALVRLLPAPGVTAATTVYLVTDQGIKYPLTPSQSQGGQGGQGGQDEGAQAFLGYGGVTPTPIDPNLLALLPTGPLLDPAAALKFTTLGGPSATATTGTGSSPSSPTGG